VQRTPTAANPNCSTSSAVSGSDSADWVRHGNHRGKARFWVLASLRQRVLIGAASISASMISICGQSGQERGRQNKPGARPPHPAESIPAHLILPRVISTFFACGRITYPLRAYAFEELSKLRICGPARPKFKPNDPLLRKRRPRQYRSRHPSRSLRHDASALLATRTDSKDSSTECIRELRHYLFVFLWLFKFLCAHFSVPPRPYG
jgi:hypothetical protein